MECFNLHPSDPFGPVGPYYLDTLRDLYHFIYQPVCGSKVRLEGPRPLLGGNDITSPGKGHDLSSKENMLNQHIRAAYQQRGNYLLLFKWYLLFSSGDTEDRWMPFNDLQQIQRSYLILRSYFYYFFMKWLTLPPQNIYTFCQLFSLYFHFNTWRNYKNLTAIKCQTLFLFLWLQMYVPKSSLKKKIRMVCYSLLYCISKSKNK